MNAWRVKISTALALCAALALLATKESRALELNDLIIEFHAITAYEQVRSNGEVYSSEPSQSHWPERIDAIAGNLVWLGNVSLCLNQGLSLVYKRGAHQGSVDCPMERGGTSTDWYERGGAATFDTKMSIAGTTVTLQGRMTGAGVHRGSSCGDDWASEIKTVRTQRLKIKIIGNRCEVLEYEEAQTQETAYTEGSFSGFTETWSYQLAPGGACVVKRRSQQPVPEPGQLASAVRKCSN